MKRYFFDLIFTLNGKYSNIKNKVRFIIYNKYFSAAPLNYFRDKYDSKLDITYTSKTVIGGYTSYVNVCFYNSMVIREPFIADYVSIKNNQLQAYVKNTRVKTINLHYIEPLSRYYDKDQLTEDLKPKI